LPADVMWHPLLVRGFAYYEVFLTATGQAVGWISRFANADSYTYDCFYCDGSRKLETQRGSFVNARAFIAELVRQFQPA
jgi:hypothetical protein